MILNAFINSLPVLRAWLSPRPKFGRYRVACTRALTSPLLANTPSVYREIDCSMHQIRIVYLEFNHLHKVYRLTCGFSIMGLISSVRQFVLVKIQDVKLVYAIRSLTKSVQ
jgi:hypothetical protein